VPVCARRHEINRITKLTFSENCFEARLQHTEQ